MTLPAKTPFSLLVSSIPLFLIKHQWFANLEALEACPDEHDAYRLVTALVMPSPIVTHSFGRNSPNLMLMAVGTNTPDVLASAASLLGALPIPPGAKSFADFAAVVRDKWPHPGDMLNQVLPLLRNVRERHPRPADAPLCPNLISA